jgi:hypothetical protein
MMRGHPGIALALLLMAAALVAAPAGAQAPGPAQPETAGQVPRAGLIVSDEGGAPGYQHGPDRSHFAVGASPREIQEFGFAKMVGAEGVFATNLRNGLVIAVPNSNAAVATPPEGYAPDPDRHNDNVLQYFLAAGLPKDQVHGVHALTRLYASGRSDEAMVTPPKVEGYTSVIEREVEGIPVADSFASAQMDPQGRVIAEWVYWPAIPARVITAAKEMQALQAEPDRQKTFLARLPENLAVGQVTIRHSSATVLGPFEAFASYDVLERRTSVEERLPGLLSSSPRVITVVRHFSADGSEFRLPQETRRAPETPSPSSPPAR